MAARLRSLFAGWRRRAAWLLVLSAVLLLHGWVVDRIDEAMAGWGSGQRPPQRLEVAFVRELKPSLPPVAAPRPVSRPHRRPPPKVAAAPASQPEAEPVAEAASAPEAVASAPVVAAAEPAASAASSASPAFDWPPSTRLSYTLTGNVDGPVNGWAKVQWVRVGTHYQVQVDTFVALVVTRRMVSDGQLTEHGLEPRRYEEETDVLLREPRRVTVLFDGEHVVLANGRVVDRPEGVQDTASQLVQLIWLFTTKPELLQPGRSVELPLALPWRVDTWVYDVLEADTVYTTFGEVPTVHLKPRRLDRPANVLSLEGWFAPTLQYLPARLRIEQNDKSYVELLLDKPPLQAEP
jgi:hypothetical protein